MMVEVRVNTFDEDVDESGEPERVLQKIGETRRKTEVNVRRFDKASVQQFKSENDEIDQ